jgi:hypothetical protein
MMLDLVGSDSDVNVSGNIGSFDSDAFKCDLPVHHSSPSWGQHVGAFFDDGAEIVDLERLEWSRGSS